MGSQDVYFEVGEVVVLNRSDGTIKFGVVQETRADLGEHVVLVGCSYNGEQIADLLKTVRVEHIGKLGPMFLGNLTRVLQAPDLAGQTLNSGTIMVANVTSGTSTQDIQQTTEKRPKDRFSAPHLGYPTSWLDFQAQKGCDTLEMQDERTKSRPYQNDNTYGTIMVAKSGLPPRQPMTPKNLNCF